MKLIVRRVLIRSVCGTVSSLFLCLAVRNIGLGLALGALLGIAQVFAFFDLRGGSAIDRAKGSVSAGRRIGVSASQETRFRNVWHGRDALPRDPQRHVR